MNKPATKISDAIKRLADMTDYDVKDSFLAQALRAMCKEIVRYGCVYDWDE